MKRFGFIAMSIVLALALTACGRKNKNEATVPTTERPTQSTTAATTAPTTKPTIPATTKPTTSPTTDPAVDPTMDTNIPDPDVEPNSTMPGNDGTDSTNNGIPEGRSGNSNRRRY